MAIDFAGRFRQLRAESGLSQAELAKQLNVSKSRINMYERGERQPDFQMQELIADYFNVDMDYLLGKSEYRNKYQWLATQSAHPANVLPMPDAYSVPLLGEIACGKPILAVEDATETVDVPSWVHADFALKCRGDSMINARIFDGDTVYIQRTPEVEPGQIAAVRIGDEATLKKVYYTGSRITLRAANPLYEDLEYSGEQLNDVEILGKAVAFTSMIR